MTQQLYFPSTLNSDRHKNIIAFTAMETDDRFKQWRQEFDLAPEKKSTSKGTVFLYMPSLGKRSYEQSYSDSKRSVMELLFGVLQHTELNMDSIKSSLAHASALIGGALGGEFRDAVSTDIENPQTTAKYQGPKLRSQTFTFDLYPRDEKELIAIAQIIQFFKFYSATRVGTNTSKQSLKGDYLPNVTPGAIDKAATSAVNGVSYALSADRLKYPCTWLIQEIPSKNLRQERIFPTFKFGPAYLEDVSITAPESVAQFASGDPVHLVLELKFIESQMLTQTDIEGGF